MLESILRDPGVEMIARRLRLRYGWQGLVKKGAYLGIVVERNSHGYCLEAENIWEMGRILHKI